MESGNKILSRYWAFCRDSLPFALLLHSFVFYFFCHFAAYYYFKNWDVDYFVFTDTFSILSFALQKPLAVFVATIFMPFCIFFLLAALVDWYNAPKRTYSLAHLFVTRATTVTMTLSIILNTLAVADLYAFDQSDINDFRLGETKYYSVQYSQGNLTCVVPIGYLGDYIVFKKSDFSTIYLRRVDVSNITFNPNSLNSLCPLQ